MVVFATPPFWFATAIVVVTSAIVPSPPAASDTVSRVSGRQSLQLDGALFGMLTP